MRPPRFITEIIRSLGQHVSRIARDDSAAFDTLFRPQYTWQQGTTELLLTSP